MLAWGAPDAAEKSGALWDGRLRRPAWCLEHLPAAIPLARVAPHHFSAGLLGFAVAAPQHGLGGGRLSTLPYSWRRSREQLAGRHILGTEAGSRATGPHIRQREK